MKQGGRVGPLKVGFDGRYLGAGRGIGNYTTSLLQALLAGPEPPELHVYLRDKANPVPPVMGDYRVRHISPKPYPLWEQIGLPRAAKKDAVDVLHCTGSTGPLHLDKSIRLVLTVYDAMYLLGSREMPRRRAGYQALGRWYRRQNVPRAARNAAAVITISDHAKQDLTRLAGMSAEQIRVIPLAAGAIFRRLKAAEVDNASIPEPARLSPYIFGLAAADPRKNTKRVVDAFAHLVAAGYPHNLLLAGTDARLARELGGMLRQREIANRVFLLDFVDDGSLVNLYNGADAFIYPSLYEGFGLPVVEAMACGAPVVTSTTSALPEVAGLAALLVNPRSTIEIASALDRVVSDRILRARMIAAGLEQARKFSWERVASATLALYREVAD